MISSPAERPRLGFWQIWNMGFGFLGIQFGFALQNANTSRIFETLGAGSSNLAFYWLAAPVTGLIVQPIIGYYSDRTWHPKWGRRRPYFAVGAIFASIALLAMPNSPTLWIAVGTLWVMDASINVSMEPFRAFVGDKLHPSQRTTGFAFQSFFIGTGAIVASFLPWIFTNWFGIPNTAPKGIVPDSVRYSFYIGGAMLFLAVFWTVFSTTEYPPDDVNQENHQRSGKRKIENESFFRQKFLKTGLLLVVLAFVIAVAIYLSNVEKELYVLALGLIIFGLAFLSSSILIGRNLSHLDVVHITKDFTTMPRTMLQLAYVQFFSWFALFSMWIYTTPAVTSHIFHSTDTTSAAYNEGANLVGNLFGGYNGIAAVAAFLLPVMAKRTSRKFTHLAALFCGGIGLISMYFVSEPAWLWLSMVGVGVAWASILSVPYAMLSGSLPPDKMGYYMGVFNFFIVIPQIVAGTLLGFLLNKFFHGQSIFVLVAGGISMILAGLLTLLVDDTRTK
jgi:maltose/moltooligosaccharide transporter